jgi:hypothetical protein
MAGAPALKTVVFFGLATDQAEADLLFNEVGEGSYGLLLPEANQLDACFLFSNHPTRNDENVPLVRPRLSSPKPPPSRSAEAAAADLGCSSWSVMFGAMYFLMIAPQRKKQKEHEKMLAALQTGDEIVTTGGIYGRSPT